MKVTITQEVSSERISYMFIGAIEGGSSYWATDCLVDDDLADAFVIPEGQPLAGCGWYANPAFFDQEDFAIIVKWFADDSSKKKTRKVIGRKDIANGLRIMANKYPRHFADMIAEEDDAATADVFFQCVVLGDIVYG